MLQICPDIKQNDIQENDILQNDIRHYVTLHYGQNCDTQFQLEH
jgi:hypothetical protein